MSAALSYHLGGFILMVLQLSGRGEWSRFPWIYLDVVQALAFLALGAVCRILSSSVFRSSDSASRVVWGDLGVVVLAIAGASAIALPLDSSGAFLLALILIVPWALPFAALLSGLSILAQRYVWLQIVLTAVLLINVALLLVGLAAGTAAP
ncbi:hypothetical protein E3T61_12835 [Cryobacterium lactosi]|uniref:Uncharacterized protein n=1 Tax=Cryobacterium lactosi TaxID=1259202 RepID=A0A4V3IWY9_9MICO|nr:hypothetical protein [Cryobacterium lactosi]TFD88004.1 hypothetical protein E3T61_12835 [Cryobacterium lactosi]